MDRVTLVDKGIVFNTRFAAPSILTGYFVAAVVDSDRATVEQAFTNPGAILVESVEGLYKPETYTDYTRINEIREQPNQIVVLLDKGDV